MMDGLCGSCGAVFDDDDEDTKFVDTELVLIRPGAGKRLLHFRLREKMTVGEVGDGFEARDTRVLFLHACPVGCERAGGGGAVTSAHVAAAATFTHRTTAGEQKQMASPSFPPSCTCARRSRSARRRRRSAARAASGPSGRARSGGAAPRSSTTPARSTRCARPVTNTCPSF